MYYLPKNTPGINKQDRHRLQKFIQEALTNPERYGNDKKSALELVNKLEELTPIATSGDVAGAPMHARIYEHEGQRYIVLYCKLSGKNPDYTAVAVMRRLHETTYRYVGSLSHPNKKKVCVATLKLEGDNIDKLVDVCYVRDGNLSIIGSYTSDNGVVSLQDIGLRTMEIDNMWGQSCVAYYEVKTYDDGPNLSLGLAVMEEGIKLYRITRYRNNRIVYNKETVPKSGAPKNFTRRDGTGSDLSMTYRMGKRKRVTRECADVNGECRTRMTYSYKVWEDNGVAYNSLQGLDNRGNDATYWIDTGTNSRMVGSLGNKGLTEFDRA